MDVFSLLGAPTGSAARAVSQLVKSAPPAAAAAASPSVDTGAAPAAGVPIPTAQTVDAPGPTPAIEQADLQNLPLAIKYAPSSPPSDALRAANVDRLA